jgi:hypothetical protein
MASKKSRIGESTLAPATETLEWHGITLRTSYSEWVLEARDQLANAARDGRWDEVLRLLGTRPAFVNAARPGGTSGFAVLHQVGYQGAPAAVVDELLRLGAWRTLRNAAGERAVDVAKRTGRPTELVERLTPEQGVLVTPTALSAVERNFHAAIRSRAEKEVTEHRLRLPELEPLTEVPLGQSVWFMVPGMYGGFAYSLERGGDDPALTAESWCRVVEGSGERHLVTAAGYELVERGFV